MDSQADERRAGSPAWWSGPSTLSSEPGSNPDSVTGSLQSLRQSVHPPSDANAASAVVRIKMIISAYLVGPASGRAPIWLRAGVQHKLAVVTLTWASASQMLRCIRVTERASENTDGCPSPTSTPCLPELLMPLVWGGVRIYISSRFPGGVAGLRPHFESFSSMEWKL